MSSQDSRLRVAIDGPAGAGKSTVAREIAKRLNLKYLDTGAMYRAVTLKAYREKTNLADSEAVHDLLERTSIDIGNQNEVFLDRENVSEEIRMSHVNELVSPVSAIPAVRRHLVALQQKVADQSKQIIMEGRDIGSRVMPEAEVKIFLDASVEERARRRNLEQQEKGYKLPLEKVIAEITNRDRIDSSRADSPLTRVPDAVVVDTTGMSFEEVVDSIIKHINERSR
jgi:cytidylate kinase